MQLAEFIQTHIEQIIAEWEAFARTTAPGEKMGTLALRDHAQDILEATVRDMQAAQSGRERSQKSQGHGVPGLESDRLEGASAVHGLGRVASGFDLMEVVSEYRALRASVLRLWRESAPNPCVADIDDITRFNESMDQSLTQAVRSYTERVDQSRQMFLAILAHDLRNPLNCIMMSAEVDSESSEEMSQVVASARVIGRLISDLIDFAGTGLGGMLPIARAPMDLGLLCQEVLAEFKASHRGRDLRLERGERGEQGGDLTGVWDTSRLRQVISNLLANALQHGDEAGPITLRAHGEGSVVVLSVHNHGTPIPPELLATIFDPLVRVATPEAQRKRRPGSIGLGLYIAREVVISHGGGIEVSSSPEEGTFFTVRLPRHPAIETGSSAPA
jgi:signal transduction histidine kinase